MAVQEIAPHQSPLYRWLACCYEPLFKKTLAGRIQQTIRSLDIRFAADVLDIGVGTGHYLDAYPSHANVVGIDLSPAMLEIAARHLKAHRRSHITLRQMNALDLQFAADTFDYVLGFHTASVVDDPRRMMEEMLRVCKPGGTIAIINHFRSQRPWLAPAIDALSPLTKWLGWHTQVKYEDLFDLPNIRVEQRYKTSPWSPFTVVVARKRPLCNGTSTALPSARLRLAHNLHPLPQTAFCSRPSIINTHL